MKCTKCNLEKSQDDFAWKYKRLGIRQHHCRQCSKILRKDWYNRNKKTHIINVRKNSVKRAAEQRRRVNDMNPECFQCGNNHPAVLDFHHKDPNTKEHSLSNLISGGSSWSKISAEMNKCVVLCSNCHRILHWNERNNIDP